MLEVISDRKALHFKDLDVWQKAFKASIAIHKTSLNFPQIEQYALADQIRRASKSICANVAEGFAKQRYSKAEFRRFLTMAIASGNEVLVWLEYCKELGYVDSAFFEEMFSEYESICRMLNALRAKS